MSAPEPSREPALENELASAAQKLRSFFRESGFRERGAIVTDLDGTAVLEADGRIEIPTSVEEALSRLVELGRPLMLNTLRFPLSVLRTFGREWYRISGRALPLVCLNGSLRGYIVQTRSGDLEFAERSADVLTRDEIRRALAPIEALIAEGIRDVLVFHYPRDWRIGEVIWTPVPEKIMAVKHKYTSASAVTAVAFEKMRAQLYSEEVCMLYLAVDVPADRRMAYQHSRGNHFVTHGSVNKLTGALAMARELGIELPESIGAGDTAMDTFLDGVGYAVIVGDTKLSLRGLRATAHLSSSLAFGGLLEHLVELHEENP